MVVVGLAAAGMLTGCGGSSGPSAAMNISGEALQSRLGSADVPLVIDVRTPGEYADGHVPGAILVPHNLIGQRLDRLEEYRRRDIVVYCARGPRAARAETVLLDAGFGSVLHLEGDMARWRRERRPIER